MRKRLRATAIDSLLILVYNKPVFDGQPHSIEIYTQADGKQPFAAWFNRLRDQTAAQSLAARLARLEAGNAGDAKTVGGGVFELRIDVGKGYRVYFALAGRRLVLLLCGGQKATQAKDIKTAKKYWAEFQRRQT